MATITTDTYLDGGTARTAGESWTISNGANLIIRTDSRWHANAPASMLGTLGAVSMTTPVGGGMKIDGTKVRWMPFNSGTGTVPAIGTTITQGGVSGYLLGVWPDYTSIPMTVGSTMPTTGYLKFREVTGGNFAAGALTGIGASATSADVTGWIEVVWDSTVNNVNNSVLGLGFWSQGDWFYLDNTSGVAGQVIQAPTNGGGSGTHIPAVQVETSPGSGIFEWWCGCYTTPWTTATTGVRPATDARSRLFQVLDGGQIRFGSDGSAAVGYTPPAGCKVRIPNIFLRAALSSSRAANYTGWTSITTGPRFSGIGNIKLWNVLSDIGIYAIGMYDVEMKYSATGSQINLTNLRNSGTFYDVARGDIRAYWSEYAFEFTGNVGPISVSKFSSVAYSSGNPFANFAASSQNITVDDWTYYDIPSTVSSISTATISGNGHTINNLKLRGKSLSVSASNTTITNFDFIERLAGDTQTTGTSYLISVSGTNCTIDGITWGANGAFANCHPRASAGAIYISNAVGCKIRNVGSASNILTTGSTAATRPTRGVYITGTGTGSNLSAPNKVQRVFIDNVQQLMIDVSDYFASNTIIEQVYQNSYVRGTWPIGQDFIVKGVWTLNTLPNNSYINAKGTNFVDFFNSTTAGRVACIFPPPSAKTASYVTTNFTSSNSGWLGGSVALTAVGEYVIIETPYYITGHTGFVNSSPSIAGTNSTTNHAFSYDIDTGSGFSGTFKTLNGANLSAETIVPTIGFKLRLKVICTTANVSNTVQWVFLSTTTTSTAQMSNLYPLDTVTLSFEGLQPGSEVRAYVGTDPSTAVEIGGIESVSGTTWSFSHSSAGQTGYIHIVNLGYEDVWIPRTYASSDSTLLIQQVVDRNYSNP